MNAQNMQYLKDQVKYMGFGDKADKAIEEAVKKGGKEFHIPLQIPYGGEKVSYDLSFKQGEKGDLYFFNNYKAVIDSAGGEKAQTFYVNKTADSFTSKEAYNLLSGRAVNKLVDGTGEEKKNVWFQLNFDEKTEKGNYKFKQYQPGYGYNLQGTLDKLGVVNEKAEDREKLVRSLNKGNLEPVVVSRDGKMENVAIAANPQFKSLAVFDENRKPLRMDLADKKRDMKVGL